MEYVMIGALASYPEVAMLVEALLKGVRSILGDHFVGMYLDGSLTSGDFDRDSDIDFVVVTDIDISGSFFSALQAMHDRIATIDAWCAIQLEGSYISQRALRRYDPAMPCIRTSSEAGASVSKWSSTTRRGPFIAMSCANGG
jgi:hypothetical protein